MCTVLVVDDSATMRRMVMAALRQVGDIRFVEAATGLEAIEQLALQAVDLIVLDMNMPDIHGMEVLAFLAQHERLRQVPVVVLTTRGDEGLRTEALQAGATLYLTKPFEPGLLVEQVRRLLGLG